MREISERNLRACVQELYAFLRSGRWDGAQPRHFAALHGWCYKRVTGDWPAGYHGKDFSVAALRAGRLMRDAFFGDAYDMADYVRWCWLAEKSRYDALALDHARGRKSRTPLRTRVNDDKLFVPGQLLVDYQRALIKRARETSFEVARAANA